MVTDNGKALSRNCITNLQSLCNLNFFCNKILKTGKKNALNTSVRNQKNGTVQIYSINILENLLWLIYSRFYNKCNTLVALCLQITSYIVFTCWPSTSNVRLPVILIKLWKSSISRHICMILLDTALCNVSLTSAIPENTHAHICTNYYSNHTMCIDGFGLILFARIYIQYNRHNIVILQQTGRPPVSYYTMSEKKWSSFIFWITLSKINQL